MTGYLDGILSCVRMRSAKDTDEDIIDDVGPTLRSFYYLSIVQRISFGIKNVFGENTIDDIYSLSS